MGKTQAQPAQPYIPAQAGITAAGNSSPGGAPATQQGTRPLPASAAPKGQAVTGTTGGGASPPSVQVMPLAQVLVQPAQDPYVTVGMEDLAPIYTSDGAMIPATARGRWGQLRAAGRP
jgi:hypothetical protein